MENTLTKSGLITDIQDITIQKLEAQTLLQKLEQELQNSDLMQRITNGKEHLRQLNEKEVEIRNKGIKVFQKAGIDKFESGGVEVRIKTSPGKLVITEEDLIPHEYIKTTTKTTTSVNKTAIKKAMKEGEIIDGVELEQEVKLEVKHK